MYAELLVDIGILISELQKNSRFETAQYFQSQYDKISIQDERAVAAVKELTSIAVLTQYGNFTFQEEALLTSAIERAIVIKHLIR